MRALDAAAALISASGLDLLTMEAVAERASCSVDSLYAVFGGRAELLTAVFEGHAPMVEIEDILDSQDSDLTNTCGASTRSWRRRSAANHESPRLFSLRC